MTRILLAFAVVMLVSAPAFADQKSDCMKGVSMLKAELKKKHPDDVRQRLQQALSNAQNEVTENDWPECVTFVTEARKGLRR
jgi:hypothetical protein